MTGSNVRARSGERLSTARLDRSSNGTSCAQSNPHAVERAAKASMVQHVQAMLGFHRQGVPTVDYGNNIRQMAKDEGVTDAFDFPGFVPAYIRPLFCRGIGPFRWCALSGDPEDIYRTDAKVRELLPNHTQLHRWLDMARERIRFQGLPARICWVGLGDRHRLGLAFNEMVARGEVSAPIVIGRDHLDSGSVASPNRETEAMMDGSDAVSDWPLLNALLNTASGATWVSIHHGGGVGMGLLAACGSRHRLRWDAGGCAPHSARVVERSGERRDASRGRRLRVSRSNAPASKGSICPGIRYMKVWHNARIATLRSRAAVLDDAAIVTADGRIEWLRPRARVGACDLVDSPRCGRALRFTGSLSHAGARRLPHASRLRRAARRGVGRACFAGATYEEIARRGGGILSTVNANASCERGRAVRTVGGTASKRCSPKVSRRSRSNRADGLTLEDERKMLRVATALGARYPVSVRTTFLAAHAVPREFAGRATRTSMK